MIGPDNQLPMKGAGRGIHSPLSDIQEAICTDNVLVPHVKADEQKQWLPPINPPLNAYEALSLFPQPKSLLGRVIQAATSSNRIKVCIFLRNEN